jgi:hypothetical protein
MAGDPDFARTRNKLAEIKAALDDLAWGAVSSDDIEAAFSRTRNKTGKAAKLAAKTGGDEDWHRWRRTARRQSQQQRILAEAGISLAVEYADREIALLLGRQQDCSLLLESCQVDQSPIRWTDRNQLNRLVEKKLESLRKALANRSVHAWCERRSPIPRGSARPDASATALRRPMAAAADGTVAGDKYWASVRRPWYRVAMTKDLQDGPQPILRVLRCRASGGAYVDGFPAA